MTDTADELAPSTPPPVCGAEVTVTLGERTEATLKCGVTENDHLFIHTAKDSKMSNNGKSLVIMYYRWDGEFVMPKEG